MECHFCYLPSFPLNSETNQILGESFYSLSGQFCVGATTVGEIVKETCKAIITVLSDNLKVPNTSEEWKVNNGNMRTCVSFAYVFE